MRLIATLLLLAAVGCQPDSDVPDELLQPSAAVAGPSGTPGTPGPAGPAGPSGADGKDGQDGAQGPMGLPGAAGGATGPRGEAGPQGVTGPTGASGPQGARGERGDRGATGRDGAVGPAGARGEAGPKGDTGAAGARFSQWVSCRSGDLTYEILRYSSSDLQVTCATSAATSHRFYPSVLDGSETGACVADTTNFALGEVAPLHGAAEFSNAECLVRTNANGTWSGDQPLSAVFN